MNPEYDTIGHMYDELLRRKEMGEKLGVSTANQALLDQACSSAGWLWVRLHRQRAASRAN